MPLGVRHDYVLFEGETVARCHRPDQGCDKNARKLALNTGSRGWSLAEYPNRSHYPQ